MNSPALYGTENLTNQEQKYCFYLARGIEPESALRRTGYRGDLEDKIAELHLRDEINMAIAVLKEKQRIDLYKENREISFTRADAHMMYLEAHGKAETATEEIKAVDSMVKLHGLNAPEKVEVEVSSVKQLKDLTAAELASIAGQDIMLDPEDYSVMES